MKRNNAFALILLGCGLSIGCNSSQPSNIDTHTNTTTTTTTQTMDATNTQPPPQFCESNCEEKAMDVIVPAKSLHLNPEEQNSLNHALKQSAGAQTHVEGTAANGSFQFHTVPGPARITANTPQIAVRSGSDPKQIVRIPLSPEAAQLARPRTGANSR